MELGDREFRLLGWLHSHTDEYLSKLSAARIANEFGGGTSTRTRTMQNLADGGWISIVPSDKPGGSKRVVLNMDRWEGVSPSGTRAVPLRDKDPVPLKDNIEEQLEEQKEKRAPIQLSGFPPIDFEEFWIAYLKHGRKHLCREYWKGMNPEDQAAALKAAPRWIAFQRDEQGDEFPKFLAHAVNWLKERGWEDVIPEPKKKKPIMDPGAKPVEFDE